MPAPRDDLVFKALADATRRRILDRLHRRDGLTLGELERQADMTRFGVMKHLRVLEAARLVVAKRDGRHKRHFLNAVPIRLLHDRWIDKYTEPLAAGLTALKRRLEGQMEQHYEIWIRTTPERLWAALTDPLQRREYAFGVAMHSDWKPGSPWRGQTTELNHQAGFDISEGEVVEADPPRRLVQTFRALWSDAVKAEGTSRLTWTIEPVGDSCRLTLVHDRLRDGAPPELYGGHPMVLSGLKTLLETGKRLTTQASLQFLRPGA